MVQDEKITLACLEKILDETQATVRAYDTKAEVLAVILTLVVGVINFTMVSEGCKGHAWVKAGSVVSIALGVFTLFAAGMVLYPRQNLFRGINVGRIKPKGTFFVLLGEGCTFNNLDSYLCDVDATDWKREIAYEVLKTSCIRDCKHYWFHLAMKCAALTLLGILILLLGIAFYG